MEGDFINKTVYIDVLLCVNLFINYFILLAVAKFSKVVPKQYRLLLGSGFGALTALIILLPEINGIANVVIKLLIAVAIIFISFGRQSKKTFIKNLATFFLISFCFCGVMMAVWFLFTPKGMVVKNSVVYFNISPVIMIVSTLLCYVILRIVSRISGREAPSIEVCKLKIFNNNCYTEIYGRVDTGNTLTEPFSTSPVIVADRRSIESVIPAEVLEYMTARVTSNTLKNNSSNSKNIRLIPYNSVGGEGLLPAFVPQEIYINGEPYDGKVFIAICPDSRITGECKAIVNPQIINR
ncbi:MAG TPA: sigma-E processing peptidase SpoIIGA [Clostridiales bacterium]|nr:sigma-E processing peptidase SpoIIGA [Clostridiales bacterium]